MVCILKSMGDQGPTWLWDHKLLQNTLPSCVSGGYKSGKMKIKEKISLFPNFTIMDLL